MKSALDWLMEDKLPDLLAAEQMHTLRAELADYKREHGRWSRRQAKFRRLAYLRGRLKNPESSYHARFLEGQIKSLEEQLGLR